MTLDDTSGPVLENSVKSRITNHEMPYKPFLMKWKVIVGAILAAVSLSACTSHPVQDTGTIATIVKVNTGGVSLHSISTSGVVSIYSHNTLLKQYAVNSGVQYRATLRAGEYKISATVAGHLCDSSSIRVSAGRRVDVNLSCTVQSAVGLP